jgi:hypothetical protein
MHCSLHTTASQTCNNERIAWHDALMRTKSSGGKNMQMCTNVSGHKENHRRPVRAAILVCADAMEASPTAEGMMTDSLGSVSVLFSLMLSDSILLSFLKVIWQLQFFCFVSF